MSKGKQQDKQLADALEKELGPEKKQEKIHLGDTPALKRALDDAAIEALRSAGYGINHIFTDLKIALGGLACIVACVAQFYPGKYPATTWVLVTCVSLYAVLSTALSGLHTFIEKDTITLTTGKGNYIIRSKLPRYQDQYTLAIRPRGTAPESSAEVKLVSSVGAYFDSQGVMVADAFKADVAALIEKAEAAGTGKSKKSQ